MAHYEPLLWEPRVRLPHARPTGSNHSVVDARSEFTARPPGRLGRPLVVEIETYLAFFALAREPAPDSP